MKSTWFANRTQYEFCSAIEDAGDGGAHMFELFRIFMECASTSIQQGARRLAGLPLCEKVEADYMQAIKRVKNPNKIAEAMALLVMELEREPGDFLGACYQSLGMAQKEFMGQCFTPYELCKLIAEMTISQREPGEARLRLAEPAAGAGAMVIAGTEVLKRRGFGPRNYFWWVTDLSEMCWRMSYVQLSLLGIPAWVLHANSLSMEPPMSAWMTPVAALYPFRDRPEEPQKKERTESVTIFSTEGQSMFNF